MYSTSTRVQVTPDFLGNILIKKDTTYTRISTVSKPNYLLLLVTRLVVTGTIETVSKRAKF